MRNTVHGMISVLLWIVFIRYWQIVMRVPMNDDTKLAIVTLGSLALLAAVYLVAWVFYNIRLSKRLQRRKTRLVTADPPLRDYVGRWIIVDRPADLATANYIEVEVHRTLTEDKTIEEKIFRTSAGDT